MNTQENVIVNPRTAMKVTLEFLFEQLADEKGMVFTQEQIKKAIEAMYDNSHFLDELVDFFESHIEVMGENYGL